MLLLGWKDSSLLRQALLDLLPSLLTAAEQGKLWDAPMSNFAWLLIPKQGLLQLSSVHAFKLFQSFLTCFKTSAPLSPVFLLSLS